MSLQDAVRAHGPGEPDAATLSSGGVDFTRADVRAALAAARASAPGGGAALIDAVLAVGVAYAPRHTLYGLASPPSEAAVASLLNEVVNPAVAEGVSLATLKSRVAAWGA